jgi:peptidoglycan/xylan/chitin deacetylase (PgdA/CDA1 family)
VNGRTVRWLLSLMPGRAPAGPRLTIVRHHRVYAPDERPLYRLGVAADVLEAQLGALRAAGLTPLSVGEGLARLAENAQGHWVAMTFDDGYADNVTRALPLLEAVGAKATFYLTAGWMDERRAAWWDELAYALEHANQTGAAWSPPAGGASFALRLDSTADRADTLQRLLPAFKLALAPRREALASLRAATGASGEPPCEFADWSQAARLADAGMEIGAHTLHHPHLSCLGAEDQRREILGSLQLIEARLGAKPTGFAYPGGDFDESAVVVVRGASLAHAVTTRRGDVLPDADRCLLARRGLSDGACLGPTGRFSTRLTMAEVRGAFDGLRARAEAAA